MFGLSVRSLLIGLFGLMAVLIGGQGFLSLNKVAAVDAGVVDIATHWLPSVDVVREMATILEKGRINDARHVMVSDAESMKATEERSAALDAMLLADGKRYEPLISSAEARSTYEEFSKLRAESQPIRARMLELSRANRKTEALALYGGDMFKSSLKIRAIIDKLVEINADGAKKATETAAANYARPAS